MQPFDPNDYRKRVLAAVERRGGMEQSDPFELYDIPLEEAERLTDAEVAARVAEVWGFWQRQRDHPKYRVLVGVLVDNHERLSYLLLDESARRAEALRIRRERQERDAERFAMLDAAVERLVQRYGGVPAGKVAGLEEIGAMSGLSAAEVAERLRGHPVVADEPRAEPAAAATVLIEQRRAEIRRLLDEWARLVDGPPAPTLLALLGLDPTRATETAEIRLRAEALRVRARELPPGRMRVVLDELLVHVRDLVEPGGPVTDAYVAAVVAEVAERLRPKVRAAVLVEDRLAGEDYDFLLEEAVEHGLDRAGAAALLADLARELGAQVEATPVHAGAAPPRPGWADTAPPPRQAVNAWMEPLKAARAALREGRPQEAARHIADARMLDVHRDGTTQIRSVADDVERVLAEAAAQWRSAATARAGARYGEVLALVEQLRRTARDVPPPTGYDVGLDALGREAADAVAEADRLVAAASAAAPLERARLLSQALTRCADHGPAAAELARTPVPAPRDVRTSRLPNGSVLIRWSPPTTEPADYRVTRRQPDGSWRVVGRTRTTELEDGAAPADTMPVYAVATALAGRYSEPARSDAEAQPRTTAPDHAAAGPGHAAAAPEHAAAAPDHAAAGSDHAAAGPDHAAAAPTTPSRAAGTPNPPDPALPDDPMPGGIPVVTNPREYGGRLVFDWPAGVTEVMVVVRGDRAPLTHDEPGVRAWKVTNMRYELDGGVAIPADLPRPCHVAIASCRREADGRLRVAPGFAPAARLRWSHPS